MRSTIKLCLEQVVTTVTTLGRLITMAQPTTCADNGWKNKNTFGFSISQWLPCPLAIRVICLGWQSCSILLIFLWHSPFWAINKYWTIHWNGSVRVCEGVRVCMSAYVCAWVRTCVHQVAVASNIYCHSLFHIPFNYLYSIHSCLLCRNPVNCN